jgi:hypothetical protein
MMRAAAKEPRAAIRLEFGANSGTLRALTQRYADPF